MEFPKIAEYCRALSIKPSGKYKAMCDYYGQWDEVHVVVIDRDDSFRDGAMKLNVECKLSGPEFDQEATADLIKKLKEFCDA